MNKSMNKNIQITASADITRAGIAFKKGDSKIFKHGELTPAQLAQIDAVVELTVKHVASNSTKSSVKKETH
ncbi:MAG: hypothetical protein COB35_05015 [Gammaproteobacteria bacterium]|nr:MAG: hypothetical protein COB35_05015 [Gammaproteobacteria bacterium]